MTMNPNRWEARYSSSEMLYLEIAGHEVRCWLDHSPQNADRYTFDEVLAGACDGGEVGCVFGAKVVEELKAAIRALPKP